MKIGEQSHASWKGDYRRTTGGQTGFAMGDRAIFAGKPMIFSLMKFTLGRA
ncbi:MAG: hypothetical protein LJE68_02670 [Rhodobacter sp.]|jgi:hypothetical protein|nr:hypothetical protein [Rhodobacter sp.]